MVEYSKDIKIIDSPSWKYLYFCDAGHPLVNKSGFIYYHRHIIPIYLGRWIENDEHVHHIDEDTRNNAIENLRLLSAGEHVALHRAESSPIEKAIECLQCKSEFYTMDYDRKFCQDYCYKLFIRKVKNRPSKEELEDMMKSSPLTQIGRAFGVRDNTVRKWAKQYSIELPDRRGFWQKQKYKVTNASATT